VQDRRHTLEVARRFVALAPDATPSEVAGALLHDIGKLEAGLGTFSRVMATMVGPRTERFRRYHDHEEIGSRMLREAGSAEATVQLVAGHGPRAETLRAADHV
jgi:putative nucleotidyltransferase with HDIG domain